MHAIAVNKLDEGLDYWLFRYLFSSACFEKGDGRPKTEDRSFPLTLNKCRITFAGNFRLRSSVFRLPSSVFRLFSKQLN